MTDNTPPAPAARAIQQLARLTPEDEAQAIKIAARLLSRRAFREATGQTDLTKPFDPRAKVIPRDPA